MITNRTVRAALFSILVALAFMLGVKASLSQSFPEHPDASLTEFRELYKEDAAVNKRVADITWKGCTISTGYMKEVIKAKMAGGDTPNPDWSVMLECYKTKTGR